MQQASESPAASGAPAAPSVWEQLADRLNPAFERPQVREGIEVRLLTNSRGEPYYIAKNPAAGTYVRLAPDEYFLLGLMDGTRQVKDLVMAYFLEYKAFAFQRIAHVVRELRQQRFLSEEPRDAYGGLRRHFALESWTYRIDRVIKSFKYHEFPLEGIDGAVTGLYRRAGWVFFTRPVLTLWALLSFVGVVLFIYQLTHGGRDPLRFGGSPEGSYVLGLLVFIPLLLLTISVHESGHALATKHFGREVPRGGVMLYYGMPAFFMDTTDIWLEPRRRRMVVSAAGMIAVWGVGGVAMLLVMLYPHTFLAAVAFQFAFVAFISNSLNLLPLLELDGYFLLMDWLELPLLRARSLAFVRGDLWRKLKAREPFNREERIFGIFGSLALVYSVFAIYAALFFWFNRLRHLVADAWQQDSPFWRILIAVVIVAFGVPVAFGFALKFTQLLHNVRGGVARLRHRREEARARARLDARELVGKLRFLGDLSFPQREAVVSQLTLQRYRPGDYVVRQGEPGEEFYLVRNGQAEVVQVGDDGWPHELAVLRRGDYFGELALLYHQPRSASVRALSRLEVYGLDRAAFETMIAPQLRDYGLTRQRIEERSELARMGLFRQTSPAELDPILDHLRTEEYPAGAVIIRQGDPGDRFYLVRRGRVAISRRLDDGTEHVLAEQGPGEYFGEMALLSDAPRTATVRALEPVVLWSLDKASFHELLLGQFQLGAALSSEVEHREATQRRLAGERVA
ncbi:MAG TPA: cyclic nucleotide-binding domain-containing protein [Chloroflexota bacterium]|nr:cyclic nucleotide-binding domain-containing protein [Chloroflexota bacterium]